MRVRDGMSRTVLVVGPGHSLVDAARLMVERRVGAAVVVDGDLPGPGIITERDMTDALAGAQEPARERVGDHMSTDVVYAAPDWSLEEAAVTMVRCGFRHLIVVDGGELAGVLSMRDIVRVWTEDGSVCELPAGVTVPGASSGPPGVQVSSWR